VTGSSADIGEAIARPLTWSAQLGSNQ
jgi:hypothetical protein